MDISKYYIEQGTGSPIVFIHGSFATTSTWKKMLEHLSSNHRCILIKLPGHGGTPEPNDFSDPSIETELSILGHVVNSLTEESIHLVGHSFGGVIALAQAIKGNLDICQLSLFEPVAVSVLDANMSNLVQSFLVKYRHNVSHKTPFSCGQVIDFWGGKGAFQLLPDAIKKGMEPLTLNNVRHWDSEANIGWNSTDFQQISVPTRLICGSKSNSIAHSICDHLNSQIPYSTKYTIKDANHFLVTSHASECIKVLRKQP